MGNLCCKRQRNQPELESVRHSSETKSVKSNSETEFVKSSSETEYVKSSSETESVKSSSETKYVKSSSENESLKSSSEIHLDEIHKTENNLELYLNDVYEKECVLKTSKEEVDFIQTGIETLVQDIVDEVLDIFSTHEGTDKIFDTEEYKTKKIKNYFERDLIDVYFPIKKGSCFEDLTDIKPTKSSIIKVGSFYEGTRNSFADEFDFIFPLFCGINKLYRSSWLKIVSTVYSCIVSVKKRKSFHYASPNETKEIYLNTGKDVKRHGPAFMLEFIYKNGSTKEIAVDLVPAYKIVFTNYPEWYIEYVNDFVKPNSFHDMVMSAESSFVVRENITFTETEVSFIRNVLSKHHVKVYRILKFLINGHGDGETMRNYELGSMQLMRDKRIRIHGPPQTAYSSYQIKTMMIYHHDECRNSDTTDIGPCVLQVLEEMCKYESVKTFPAFSDFGGYYGEYLVDYLQSLVASLKSMLTITDSYSYKGYKIKSISMQYTEQLHQSIKAKME